MKIKNYKDLKKGFGIIVAIPGDEHNGKQNNRPGIVINSEPEYITVQLLSSRSSDYDFASFVINNKTQYVRSIYLKNVLLNQIKGTWKDLNNNSIKLNFAGKTMQAIEKNPYKATSLTLGLYEYLNFNNTIKVLEKENEFLKQENQNLKIEQKQLKLDNINTEFE